MNPRPLRSAPFTAFSAPTKTTQSPVISGRVVNNALSAQRQGRAFTPVSQDQPGQVFQPEGRTFSPVDPNQPGQVFQSADQNPNPNQRGLPPTQQVQSVQARRPPPLVDPNKESGAYSIGMQNYDPRQSARVQAAPISANQSMTQPPTQQEQGSQQAAPNQGMGMLDIINKVAEDARARAEDARKPQTATSSVGLTANPDPPGQVDPNPPAQAPSNAPPAQTSNRGNSNAGQGGAPDWYNDPLAGLAPHEQEALLKGAADNQMALQEARALWEQGYRPDAYWGDGGDYDSSWYRESDETAFILDQKDGKRWRIGKKSEELGMDADEGGRAMAKNLLADYTRQTEQDAKDQAQAEFDSLIERIMGMEGPDITQALEASRNARERQIGRANRSLYASSLDPRAMQAISADLSADVAAQGAQQDANLALQKEMMRYANQIDALKAAASLAGNVAQATKLNDVTFALQAKLAMLAQQNALFERNLMTPSFGEILGGFATQVGGGALSAFAQAGAKKVFGL